ncbi:MULTISPECIES: response regulator transcription factor [Rheinheimera]|jgi:DNA-binding NarL/FixJ family response regulator|uniref:response regulator transcription factor n=1 Tax=Rheinheimera TaxID=67575 RepID=UPI000E88BA38|nr:MULTISPECIES: response regulator transcription factor [Rheinheimera]MCD1597936.1 response regulator transcription factor [Rheinheimera aquimaris]HBN88297.1 DNA-binding response regulator [Rheinheimera sp.]
MIKVLLADDQKLIRDGIRSLLALSDKVEVVAECADGTSVIASVIQSQPDVILLDLSMPVMNGIQTLGALQQAGINIPVLILTTFDEHELVLKSISCGARGFLLKDVSLDTLIEAIATLAQGGSWFAPNITQRLLETVKSSDSTFTMPATLEPLTEKELEILQLMAAGYSNKEIASALYKSEGTVKNQCSAILAKLGVRDRTRAVLLALELGLIS